MKEKLKPLFNALFVGFTIMAAMLALYFVMLGLTLLK